MTAKQLAQSYFQWLHSLPEDSLKCTVEDYFADLAGRELK